MTCRNRSSVARAACVSLLSLLPAVAVAQTTTQVVEGPDGRKYRETRTVTERLVPTTEYQTSQQQVYVPRTTTNYQTYQQHYLTPVTEYRWVWRRRGVLNPFVEPYWTQQLEPFTRWESRPATVQVPVTSTDWVAETRSVSTPVTKYKPVREENIRRVAISEPATAPAGQPAAAIASRPQTTQIGGRQRESDPPRAATGWQSGRGSSNRYR